MPRILGSARLSGTDTPNLWPERPELTIGFLATIVADGGLPNPVLMHKWQS